MGKLLRIALAIGLVSVMAWLAKGPAWADFLSRGSASVAPKVTKPEPASRSSNRGTVKPPPAALIIRRAGNFSAGGFCLIRVEFLSPEFLIEVERSYYSGFGQPLPEGIFLSAVCHLQYHTSVGQHLAEIPLDQGSVQICFADIPFRSGDIFVYSPPLWTALPTTTDNLLACAPANWSGFYVRRGR